jgi:flagellar biosynthetic protein FliR
MHAELSVPLSALFGFLLVLARVSGVFIFVPIPGFQSSPEAARVVLSLTLSFVLMPLWPSVPIADASMGKLLGWIAVEFTFGLLIGVTVSFILEGLQIGAQMIGLQAGYSFASTVDPSTQADSAVLQVVVQMLAGFLFFGMGLDRMVMRALAMSLEKMPVYSTIPGPLLATKVSEAGSLMFAVGLRLALPVIALLVLMDLSFAVMGKVHAQFQIMSLAFPAKMLVGMGLMATTLAVYPKVVESVAGRTFEAVIRLLGK